MNEVKMPAQKLLEISEMPVPPETLALVKDASPEDACQIGWDNCFQVFWSALQAEAKPSDQRPEKSTGETQ